MIPFEHCGHKDAELRNSDMNLCDGCHQENVLQCMRNLLEKENLEVQEFELEKDEEEPTMTVADTRIYDAMRGTAKNKKNKSRPVIATLMNHFQPLSNTSMIVMEAAQNARKHLRMV